MTSIPATPEPEGADVLAADLAHLDEGQYRIVADWMLDHGWTEPLDPVRDTVGDEREALRESLADMVNQFGYWSEGENPGLTTGGLSALGGAFAALGYDDPQPAEHLRCDEPGCTKQSGMGTPTMTGYRSTCWDHRPPGLTVGQRREQAEWMQANPTRTFNDWVAALNRRQDDR